MKKFLVIMASIILLLFSGCSSDKSKDAGKTAQPRQLKKIPDFSALTIDGEQFSMYQHKGKVVIINFWATWCPPCVAEIPSFIKLTNKYESQGLLIVGINLDNRISERQVRDFVIQQGINYPVIYGAGNPDVLEKFPRIGSIPTTYIVDRAGNIRQTTVGMESKEFFEKWINKLLSEEIVAAR